MSKAVSILKKAQALLAARLSEYVIENEEGFLESSSGADLGLHNEVYDLADKLRDLSIILSVMPDVSEPVKADPSKVQVVQSEGGTVVQTPPAMTYETFISSVQAGYFREAAIVLAHLFQVSVVRA